MVAELVVHEVTVSASVMHMCRSKKLQKAVLPNVTHSLLVLVDMAQPTHTGIPGGGVHEVSPVAVLW